MIKCEKSDVKLIGEANTLFAEFTMITDAMNQVLSAELGKKMSREILEHIFGLAFKSTEEIDEMTKAAAAKTTARHF